MQLYELETERLKLRQWSATDRPPFAELNADPEVMAFYPSALSEAQSDQMAKKLETLIANRGWGLWAVELRSGTAFIGYLGLHEPTVDMPFGPCIEIGWRLAKAYWGNGYATEGGRAVLDFAFNTLLLDKIVSFTSVINVRSEAVMRRLNMKKCAKNFKHPALPAGHRLSEHVLYKLTQTEWAQRSS